MEKTYIREYQLIILQTYADPPAITPVQNRPKDDKAFDNTAFVDYEEPLSIKTEYYQLNDVLEPNESGKEGNNTILRALHYHINFYIICLSDKKHYRK